MALPPLKKRVRSGIERAPQKIFQTHRQFVRRHACSVPGCSDGPIEFAHAKSRGAGGHDSQGVSLCLVHHREQHDIGIETFQKKYRIDLFTIALEFAQKSTDKAMIEAMKTQRALPGSAPVPAPAPARKGT